MILAIPVVVALVFGVLALKAWVVMLLLGALHSHIEAVPALGFAPSLWLTLLVGVLIAGTTATPRS